MMRTTRGTLSFTVALHLSRMPFWSAQQGPYRPPKPAAPWRTMLIPPPTGASAIGFHISSWTTRRMRGTTAGSRSRQTSCHTSLTTIAVAAPSESTGQLVHIAEASGRRKSRQPAVLLGTCHLALLNTGRRVGGVDDRPGRSNRADPDRRFLHGRQTKWLCS